MQRIMRRPFPVLASTLLIVVIGGIFISMLLLLATGQGQMSRQVATTAQAVYLINTAVQNDINGTKAAVQNSSSAPGQGQTAQQQAQKRLVIKNATLTTVVDDVPSALTTIDNMASDMGGWIVSSSSYKAALASGDAIQATITIRVPAERFDEALARIKAGAKSVEREDITGQDVTKEYTDLVSQQTNLEAAEAKLRDIMDAAKETKDVLDVYNQLVKVQGDLETIKGQIKYYEESAAFSSIAVTLIPPQAPRPIGSTGWAPLDTARDALASLVQFGQGLVNVLIWLVIFIVPLGIVFGIPTWIGWRVSRRFRRSRPATAQPPAANEESASSDSGTIGSE